MLDAQAKVQRELARDFNRLDVDRHVFVLLRETAAARRIAARMRSNRAVRPARGARVSNGPLPHRLLKLNTGELSAE